MNSNSVGWGAWKVTEGWVGNELNQAEHEPAEDAPIVTVIQLLEYAL